jgi:phosphopantetheinyl transferase
MLAVSRHHEIGIDIERNRSIENALEIAECFF